MADDEWRSVEIIKLLRQCVICPFCGVLVATQAGIDSHISWHDGINTYVASIDERFTEFSDYITDPVTGLQKQFQDRLDTITNYVVAPVTGLEPRVTAALAQLRSDAQAYTDTLRADATSAIGGLTSRVTALEAAVAALNIH